MEPPQLSTNGASIVTSSSIEDQTTPLPLLTLRALAEGAAARKGFVNGGTKRSPPYSTSVSRWEVFGQIDQG